ncbi:MAG: dihydroorotate dehydrogenase [Halanaerobiales bacterium]|nr:dihydroorotate dehydrogenase [Halanaerobiales bacterium]
MKEIDLSTKLGEITLKNPVITASGTCGYGQELEDYMDLEQLGALTVKGITLQAKTGNPVPRIVETPAGILNSIGLENPGLEGFLADKIKIIKGYQLPVFVNISGYSIEDFVLLAEKLAEISCIAALEVNVSCPNIPGGGLAFGTDPELIYQITKQVKAAYPGSVIVKLSPNVTAISDMAIAAQEGGADIISLINTLQGMAIDLERQKPVFANTFGGLSGPAIKPVALRMVYQVAQKIKIPIIGMGGIMTGQDAVEFLLAGASAVAIGTATLIHPDAPLMIIKEIKAYLQDKKINNIQEIIGKVLN